MAEYGSDRKWSVQIGGPLCSVMGGSKLQSRLAVILRVSHKHTPLFVHLLSVWITDAFNPPAS